MTACAERWLKLTSIRKKLAVSKKKIKELSQHLLESLLVKYKNVAKWRHKKDAVADKEMLAAEVKQLSARVKE